MRIAPLKQAHLRQISPLQPPDWPPLLPSLQYYLAASYCHPFAAWLNRKPVAVGCLICHEDSGWLAHIVVHPQYRRRGLGQAMTVHLMDLAQQKGIGRLALVATDAGAGIYQKLGFRPVGKYQYYRPKLTVPPNNIVIIPSDRYYYETMLELDREASGEIRRSLMAAQLQSAFLVLEEGSCTGMFMPHLGEGMILARTHTAGNALLQLKYASPRKLAVIPEDNSQANGWAVHQQFQPFAIMQRMHLGPDILWKPALIFHRIGGNLG